MILTFHSSFQQCFIVTLAHGTKPQFKCWFRSKYRVGFKVPTLILLKSDIILELSLQCRLAALSVHKFPDSNL